MLINFSQRFFQGFIQNYSSFRGQGTIQQTKHTTINVGGGTARCCRPLWLHFFFSHSFNTSLRWPGWSAARCRPGCCRRTGGLPASCSRAATRQAG
jgi:hypothetical protein